MGWDPRFRRWDSPVLLLGPLVASSPCLSSLRFSPSWAHCSVLAQDVGQLHDGEGKVSIPRTGDAGGRGVATTTAAAWTCFCSHQKPPQPREGEPPQSYELSRDATVTDWNLGRQQ